MDRAMLIFHATNTSSFALQVNLLDEETKPGKHFFCVFVCIYCVIKACIRGLFHAMY